MVRMFKARNQRSRPSRQGRVPRLESLETRKLLATFTVTNTNDSGAGSLSQAILDANSQAIVGGVPNTIAFHIPGTGLHKISLQNALPIVTNPVIINGYSQPGASPNTNPIDQPDNALLQIQLDGSQNVPQGLVFGPGTAGSTIEGLDITGFSSPLAAGITLSAVTGENHVVGNFIGVDPTGMLASSTLRNYSGVEVDGPNNTIGGSDPADRNVISGNANYGIYLNGASATNTFLEGNFVGLKADGNSAFPAGGGAQESIFVSQADHTFIGGTSADERNVVAGIDAIALDNANNTTIQGNYIGTDRTGTAPVVSVKGITVARCHGTYIGGTASGAGNVLGANALGGQIGVLIDLSGTTTVQGNFIGTDSTQTHDIGPFEFGVSVQRSTDTTIGGTTPGAGNVIANNSGASTGASVFIPITGAAVNDVLIEGNVFYGNEGPAILGSNTNAPVLTAATTTNISGHIVGAPGATYRVEYFATPNTGGASNQQAGTLLGFQDNLVADSSGNVTLSFSPPGGVPAGEFITATATKNGASTSGVGTGILATSTSAALGVNVVSPITVAPGGNITYTIDVANSGPDAALQTELNAAVPAGTTLVSFVAPAGWNAAAPVVGGTGSIAASIASLPSGGMAVFTFVVKVNSGAAGGLTIPMTSTVSTATSDPNPASETASASTTVVAPSLVATNTTVSASPGPSAVGQPVTLVALVKGTSGVPKGSVTFKDGATTLGVVPLDQTGRAVLTTSTFSVGSHAITALYSGDATFAASQGATSQVVAKSLMITQTLLGSSANPAVAGKPVTFVASVTGTGGVPSGSVTFAEGTSTLGVVALDQTGHATLTISNLGVGNHAITATYSGNADSAGSQGAISQVVQAAQSVQGAGPQVIQFQRLGYHWMPTALVLTVDSPLEVASAQNRDNYRITSPGGRLIGIGSVVYSPEARTVTIHPSRRLNVHWTYFLQVNGTTATGLRGADGALLNAAGAGLPGHDYKALVTRASLHFTPR